MDVDSLEWYVQQFDETFKAAGGIILNKDETIGNVSVFRPSGGPIGITPEEDAKRQELKELGKDFDELLEAKKASQERLNAIQQALFTQQQALIDEQEAIDLRIFELKKRMDKLTGQSVEQENDSAEEK